jgi:tRNA pseudouridine55 synthase
MALSPLIFALNKPAGMGSQDVLRLFKRQLPRERGKVGHFGTLDPFACGLFLVGINGAQRLNEYIHRDLPKTYLAVGKLGVEMDTGDHTGTITQTDSSPYLEQTIAQFDVAFIQEQLKSKLGKYMQSPHAFSASKHMGKSLHEWAREGQLILKPQKERHIYKLEVVKYAYPYLTMRTTVSAGTFVRTLFSDCAQILGTIGHLVELQREKIGSVSLESSLNPHELPSEFLSQGLFLEDVLPYPQLELEGVSVTHFSQGRFMATEKPWGDYWVKGDGKLLGLGQIDQRGLRPKINFSVPN